MPKVSEFIDSSGNVFEDAGFADAEERLFKADLAIEIWRIIEAKGLSQAQAASIAGVSQPRISNILNDRTSSISVDSLLRIIYALGYRVPVHVEPVELHQTA